MTDDATVIAVRNLELGEAAVSVSLLEPRKIADGEYRCDFIIEGIAERSPTYAIGQDSVQSIVIALEKIGIFLYTSDAAKSGNLKWYGEDDLGFPVPKGFDTGI